MANWELLSACSSLLKIFKDRAWSMIPTATPLLAQLAVLKISQIAFFFYHRSDKKG